MEGLIFVLVALVVGALGVGIGILVAPRITRFVERTDDEDEDAADPDAPESVTERDRDGPETKDEGDPGGRTTDGAGKDE